MARAWVKTACLGLAALCLSGCFSGSAESRKMARYRPATDDRNVAVWTDSIGGVAVEPVGAIETNRIMNVPAWQRPLQRGDKITMYLAITGNPQTDKRPDVVDDEGNVNLPLIGRVRVDGKSRSEAQAMIEKAYVSGGLYKNISVTIIVEEEDFFVDGEVKRPGRYPLRPGMTAMHAIAAAGGPSEYADKADVQITRESGSQIIRVNANRVEDGRDKDVVLKAGDLVKIGRRLFL